MLTKSNASFSVICTAVAVLCLALKHEKVEIRRSAIESMKVLQSLESGQFYSRLVKKVISREEEILTDPLHATWVRGL
jgi:hypothetical protein